MVNELAMTKTKGKVFRAPTSVDPDEFYFKPVGREKIRQELNLTDDQQIILGLC